MTADQIGLAPIGIIHTPYDEVMEMPIQGRFRADVEGWIELEERYVPGLVVRPSKVIGQP